MNINEESAGNLYKFMTVLGAILIYVCVSGTTSLVNKHDENILAVYQHVLVDENTNAANSKAYIRFLETSKRNTECSIWALCVGILIGTGFSITGGSLWWYKHQRYEDLRASQPSEARNEDCGHVIAAADKRKL